jgi:ferritin-like metal-binding protein YciE
VTESAVKIESLKHIYISELQEQRSAEEQLIQALPKMSEMAHDPDLAAALQEHLRETRTQLDRLDEMLSRHGAAPRAHKDRSMETILGEAGKWAMMIDEPEPRDAGLIASAQRIEHYEIAVYGTLATWAKQLGLRRDMDTLLVILEEEKSADWKLTALAKRQVNPEAVG